MRIKKRLLYIIPAAILALLVCLLILKPGSAPSPVTLNVSLYKIIPEYDAFEKTLEECWKEKHPETELKFVEWDCYSGTVPDDLDVFVFDSLSLDAFESKGYLLHLTEDDIQDEDDLIPAFVQGCMVDGSICAVPQIVCTDLLYTRKQDADMKDVRNTYDLYNILGDGGLLMEKQGEIGKAGMYLQAIIDAKQQYTDQFPPVEKDALNPDAIDSLETIRKMHEKDAKSAPPKEGSYYYGRQFAEGKGRAYLGYSEAMNDMEDGASAVEFRLFSMTKDENIPVFYVDAAAVNAKIDDGKRALAFEFLNMITGKDLMVRISKNNDEPRYLLSARYSVYDAMAPKYPIYEDLKKIVTVPDAFVFRIKPDGDAYMKEAQKNVQLLPPFDE